MLYIMRHGRTVWNMEHKLQGKTDVPLSEAGRPVVEQAAAAYRDTHIDVCYCSPLIRAVETAEIVLRGREIPIITDVRLEEMGFGGLPVCMAKTQYSFSDDQTLLGAPSGFEVTVRNLKVSAGAGFIVALTGDIMTMPGLPKVPAAVNIDVTDDGKITGLF